MCVFNNLQQIAHRLTKDRTGKIATGYIQILAYVAIAVVIGRVLLGDNFDAYLSEIRRVLFGTVYG